MARLANKDEANAEFRRKYDRVFRRHRAEFIRLLGSPPSAANVPEAFWEKLRSEVEAESVSMMILLFIAAATQSQMVDGDALRMSQSTAETAAQQYASEQAGKLANAVVQNTREAARQAFDGAELLKPEVVARVNSGRILGPSRAASMGTTEATKAVTAGGEAQIARVEREGVDIVRLWQHQTHRPPGHANAMVNPCPICSPLEDRRLETLPPIPTHETGKTLQDGPPAHPNCDCFIEYRFASPARTNVDKMAFGEV